MDHPGAMSKGPSSSIESIASGYPDRLASGPPHDMSIRRISSNQFLQRWQNCIISRDNDGQSLLGRASAGAGSMVDGRSWVDRVGTAKAEHSDWEGGKVLKSPLSASWKRTRRHDCDEESGIQLYDAATGRRCRQKIVVRCATDLL